MRFFVRFKTQTIARAAVIAAVYVALCLVFAPFSFGPVQVRLAEALTLLPILCPEAVLGVTVGCFLSNLIASAPIDMVVGTAATLLAALATRKLRHMRWHPRRRAVGAAQNPGLPLAASLPPVLFNAVIVGAELTLLYFPAGAGIGIYLMNMLSVGVGQLVSCCGLGLLLIWSIERKPALRKLFN